MEANQGIRMMIIMKDNGEITVTGPIDNKVLTYGMLSMAKDAIKDYHDRKKNESRIEVPTMVPPFPLKGN